MLQERGERSTNAESRLPAASSRERVFVATRPTPERRRAAEKVLDAFATLQKEYGADGVEFLVERLKAEKRITGKDVADLQEQVSSLEEYREKLTDYLFRVGALERKGQHIVADLDAIRGLRQKDMVNAKGLSAKKFAERTTKDFRRALAESIGSLRVISKEDWENGIREPDDLLYVPKSPEDAVNPEAIRAGGGYLGLWEIQRVKGFAESKPYPTDEGAVSFAEASVAGIVFHPRYGNGERDKIGRVRVTNPKTGKRVQLSSDWFVKDMGYSGGGGEGVSLSSPKAFIEKVAQGLYEHGTFRREDFSELTVRNQEKTAARSERTRLNPSGELMLNGVIHYIGKRFVGKPIRIFELSPGIGAIAESDENSERITHTFRILEPGDERLTQVKYGSGKTRGRANPELTEVTPFDPIAFSSRRQSESIDAYKKRIEDLERFESTLRLSRKLSTVGVQLNALPYDEQVWIAKAMERGLEGQMLAMASEYGLDGIRSLASFEYGASDTKGLLSLEARLGKPFMRSLFAKYKELTTLADNLSQEMIAEAFEKDAAPHARDVSNELLQRAREVIQDFVKLSAKEELKGEDLMRRLDAARSDIQLFAASFKVFAKGKKVHFEDMRGLSFGSQAAMELTSIERNEIRMIAETNWRGQAPDAASMVLAGLNAKLSAEGTTWILLKKDGRIVACMREDERTKNTVYVGSLNVSPALRGSGIGEAVLREAMDRAAATHTIQADFFPEIAAGSMYVEEMRFVVNGTESVDLGNGKRAKKLLMERNDRAEAPRARAIPLEGLIRFADGKPHDGITVLRVDFPAGAQKFADDVERYTRAGMAMTRYIIDPSNPRKRYAAFEVFPLARSAGRRTA